MRLANVVHFGIRSVVQILNGKFKRGGKEEDGDIVEIMIDITSHLNQEKSTRLCSFPSQCCFSMKLFGQVSILHSFECDQSSAKSNNLI